MRSVKTLTLVLSAAIAALALVGTGSASAAPWATLCEENMTLCEAEATYPASTAIEAELEEEASLAFANPLGGGLAIECSESALAAETSAKAGSPLSAEVSSWSIGDCDFFNHLIFCSSKALNLPYQAGIDRTSAGDGELILQGGTGGDPRLRIKCPSIGVNCIFDASDAPLDLEGGNPAGLAIDVTLPEVYDENETCEGLTGLTASYGVSDPAPLFITGSGLTSFCATAEEPCQEGDLYEEGTEFAASLSGSTEAEFALGWAPLRCSASTLSGEFRDGPQKAGEHQLAEISGQTFSNCRAFGGALSCTVEALSLSYRAQFVASEGGDGTLEVGSYPEQTRPGWRLKCSSFAVDCIFRVSEDGEQQDSVMFLDFEGGNPATLTASKVQTELTYDANESCEGGLKFSAEYGISTPASLFLTGL